MGRSRMALVSRPTSAAEEVAVEGERRSSFDQYRSYVINYNLGKDMVRTYIESLGGAADKPAKRWESPSLPSNLR